MLGLGIRLFKHFVGGVLTGVVKLDMGWRFHLFFCGGLVFGAWAYVRMIASSQLPAPIDEFQLLTPISTYHLDQIRQPSKRKKSSSLDIGISDAGAW